MLEMFDLNVSPINIDDYEPESISHRLGTTNSYPPATLSEAPSESRGHTVPTAPTVFVAPDVEEGVEVMSTPIDPHVGMTFDSLDAAKSYYNSYARYKCFGTRIDTTKSTKKDNGKSKCLFVCHKEGVNKKLKSIADGLITEKKLAFQRHRDHVERMKCHACMVIKVASNGIWEVVSFVQDHNHELVTKFSLTKFLSSHQEIPVEEVHFIKTLHGCCIGTTRV
jgi:hypothetical protein